MEVGLESKAEQWDKSIYWLNVGIAIGFIGMCAAAVIHASGSPGESKNLPTSALMFAGLITGCWAGLLLVGFHAGRQDVGLTWLRGRIALTFYMALGVGIGRAVSFVILKLSGYQLFGFSEQDPIVLLAKFVVAAAIPLPVFYVIHHRRAQSPQS